MTSTITTETIATSSHKGHEITVVRETRHYGEDDTWTFTEARSEVAGRTRPNSGWSTEKLIAQHAKAIDNELAIQAILPAAELAALDYGRDFDPKEDQHFIHVDHAKVELGDLVWVYSFQVWRRGVVEAIGRTNLKVAVVVQSTRTFSRQSVKEGQAFWDIFNH